MQLPSMLLQTSLTPAGQMRHAESAALEWHMFWGHTTGKWTFKPETIADMITALVLCSLPEGYPALPAPR